MKLTHLKRLIMWLALCVLGGKAISWLSGMPLWGGVVIVAISLFINGLIAEAEDSETGGINHPRS